ncbi:MAG: hypothetical protein EA388_15310, partial [Nitriliruptor sp.]
MSDPRWPEDGSGEASDPHDADQTRQQPAQPGGQRSAEPWEAEVPVRSAGSNEPGAGAPDGADDPGVPPDEPGASGRGKRVAIGVISGLAGFILAFIVIAIFTGDDEAMVDPGIAASEERIEALEAELGDRDLQIEELDARLDEAEAALGESDADIEAQREALDERATALDQRASALDEREVALDQRDAAITEREQQADVDPAPADPDPDPGDNGLTPPEFDEDQVENIV